MFIDKNDDRTPRERVDETFLRRMLAADSSQGTCACKETRQELPCNPDVLAQNERAPMGHSHMPAGHPAMPMSHPLGMVYCPPQAFRALYDMEKALARGTMFEELDKPWEVPAPSGKGGCCCG